MFTIEALPGRVGGGRSQGGLEGAGELEGRAEVDLDDIVPVGAVEVGHGPDPDDARAVDERIDLGVVREDRVGEGSEGGPVREVAGTRLDPTASVLDRVPRRCERLVAGRHRDDAEAVIRETLGDGGADAPARPRDDRPAPIHVRSLLAPSRPMSAHDVLGRASPALSSPLGASGPREARLGLARGA